MSERRVDYEGDERTISMEDLERVLCDHYGWSDYDKEAGCNTWEGGWFSIDRVLKLASEEAY